MQCVNLTMQLITRVGTPTWNSYQAFLDRARWCLETRSVGCIQSLGTIILITVHHPHSTVVCRNLTEHGVPLNPWVSVLQYQYTINISNGKNQLKSVVMLKRNAIKILQFVEMSPNIYLICLYCLFMEEGVVTQTSWANLLSLQIHTGVSLMVEWRCFHALSKELDSWRSELEQDFIAGRKHDLQINQTLQQPVAKVL